MKGFAKVCFIGVLVLSGCNLNSENIKIFSFSFDFAETDEDWSGDFADYPEGDSLFYELEYSHGPLPQNVSQTRMAIKLSGNNHSDDLFMFIKRKLTGLRPNATYQVLFNVRFASNAPTEAVGAGGAPGESVYVKAGATSIEPRKVLSDGYYEMNIDKGNQSQGGNDMMVIGHVGVAATTTQFTEVYRNNNSSNPFTAKTNSQGELWIIIGTDSGFEGTTTLYYTSVDVLFNEVD